MKFALVATLLAVSACGQTSHSSVRAVQINEGVQTQNAKQINEFVGELMTPVYAIGGETTGVALKLENGKVVELDLKKAVVHANLEDLNGKRVSAKGILTNVRGVEIRNRTIVRVAVLTEAKDPSAPPELCDAYFVGADFNVTTQSCEKSEASGCSFPFEFRSVEQCKTAINSL